MRIDAASTKLMYLGIHHSRSNNPLAYSLEELIDWKEVARKVGPSFEGIRIADDRLPVKN